ncbi:Uncharacterised protein [uncultured archaeon]|nr:Uncharacterised protein [uncultured archaeon]
MDKKITLLLVILLSCPATANTNFTQQLTPDWNSISIPLDVIDTPPSRLGICSGQYLTLTKTHKYKLLINFTDADGQHYDNLRLDQGPFSLGVGDRFLVDGKIYEYENAQRQSNDTTMRITVEDIFDGGNFTTDLTAVTTPASIDFYTYPYESVADNLDEITVKPDPDYPHGNDVFTGQFGSTAVTILYDGGDIYLFPPSYYLAHNITPLNRKTMGVEPQVLGPAPINNFEAPLQQKRIWFIKENGTDLNNEGPDANLDDILVEYTNYQREYVLIDMYDRAFDSTTDTRYIESVRVSTQEISNNFPLNSTYQTLVLNDDNHTVATLPQSGNRITVDYGENQTINSVEICY